MSEGEWKDAADVSKYRQFRPNYEPTVISWLRDFLGPTVRPALAIDVGCGTGQLSVPLAEFCDRVVAVDIAAEMLSSAELGAARHNIDYRLGDARNLTTVVEGSADLLVAGMAAHYFDCDSFYAAAQSLVSPGGVIALFGYYCPGFEETGLDDALNTFFERAVVSPPRKVVMAKLQDGYRSLYCPLEDVQPRREVLKVLLSREQVRGLLETNIPLYKDGAENVREFMRDFPSGESFTLKLEIYALFKRV